MKPPKDSPCRECPFRKKSLPGYLGAATPAQFVLLAEGGEVPLPCHMDIDYEKEDWETKQMPKAHQCAGHAIFLTNMCKGGVGPEVRRLPQDTENVFQFPSQMLQHHTHGKMTTMGDAYQAVLAGAVQPAKAKPKPSADSCVGKDTQALVEHVRELMEATGCKGVRMQSLSAWINRSVAYTHRLCRDSPELVVDGGKVRVRDYTVRLRNDDE